MATIYSGAPSQSRFPFSTHTHYTSNADAAAQIQMQQFRYSGGYAIENQLEASSPPSLAPPGASIGFLNKQQMYVADTNSMRLSSPGYSSQQNVSTAMYMQSMMSKMYQPQQPHPPPMDLSQQHTEVLLVSPGVPTPVELSIYENKQPTGFLHVTIGNQTVEFLDGVANMPQKR